MTWAKYIFATITIILLYDIFNMLVAHLHFTLKVQIELILAFITGASYYYFSQRKHVEYDAKSLYIIWQKKEKRIPLTEVEKVRLTFVKINNKPTWKIDYKDSSGLKENVRLIPNKRNTESFESFKTYIKESNPNVKIDDSAKSF